MYQNQHKMLRGRQSIPPASKEEIELSKRYIFGINDKIKKHKYFSSSVIKGRRLTVDQTIKRIQDLAILKLQNQ